MSDGGFVCCVNIVGDQGDLHSQRLLAFTGMHMARWEVQFSECVRRKRKRGFAGVEFAVVAGVMQKFLLKTEGFVEEPQRRCDAGDVDDGVAKFHGGVLVGLGGERLPIYPSQSSDSPRPIFGLLALVCDGDNQYFCVTLAVNDAERDTLDEPSTSVI